MPKKFLLGAVLLLLVVVLSGCQSPQDKNQKTVDQDKEQKVYVASGHPEWPPIMWQAGDQIVGVGPELVEQIMAKLGLPVEIKYVGLWDEVQAKAKSGEVDLLVAAYKTAERETYMDYSVAYTEDPIAVFVKNDSQWNYEKWEDLEGKRGVLTVGDSYGQAFDDFIKNSLKVERVKTIEEAFDYLRSGQADYFVYALYSGEKFLAENDLAKEFKILPQYVAAENFYLTIARKSPLVQYLPQINEQLEKMKNDGTIAKLIEKYKKEMVVKPVVGGDKDEHGCIGSAGYLWCAPKSKCLRIWEEECYKDAAEEVQYILANKYKKEPGEVKITVSRKDETHLAGSVAFGQEKNAEGGLFLAAKIDNVWAVVYDGNGSIDCEQMKKEYGFTNEILRPNFCD